MTVFSKQYQRALSTSNISVLPNLYQIFDGRNQKLSRRSEKLQTPSLLNLAKSNPPFGLDCPFLLRGTAPWFFPFSETFPKKAQHKISLDLESNLNLAVYVHTQYSNSRIMEEVPIFLKKSEFVLLNLDATIKSNVFLDECTLASFPES